MRANIKFTTHRYDYDPAADHIGLQAADALGVAPNELLKTLMATVDGKPVCVIVPSGNSASMKKLAAALHGKAAQMMTPADAERVTGYKVGGISPFGQRRRLPVVLEASVLMQALIYVNGGQRGLQLRLDARELRLMLDAVITDLIA